ncbi:amino acid permease [Xenorhabdus sp. PB61.4]|uniref:amino acid permease n=1 Tax=Xenorhabdus sp. PB61.4 TaxID=2788940 RepID=UPI001E53DA37|nr:amino acid permease [Xenorhabdus sp. PB61.4]MCC8368358.1 amino acid permease [Xenorhabdus sp. PB61.4]
MVKGVQKSMLNRSLKNRHIQLIALGGSIGTGLFLGVGQTIKIAGPAVLLGYAIAGFFAFIIMRQLGEMIVAEPVAGSFSYFANKYWGNFAGFLSGWNYWIMFILVGMTELTAIGIYIQYWWPDLPTWVPAAIAFFFINLINIANVRLYGEMECWFSLIKIFAIVCVILFGLYLLISEKGENQTILANLWQHGGFMPNGFSGLFMSMAIIMFSFGGLEGIGVTAAEAQNPQITIPKAIKQIIYRIILFYILSLFILLSLYPWKNIIDGVSPFVLIFYDLNSFWISNILNIVVLIAALSVYNNGVYCNSRILYGLAKQGNAPKLFSKTNRYNSPIISIAFSALITSIGILLNYILPNTAFEILMSLVVTTLVINWFMICISHLKFRKIKNEERIKSKFKSIWYPFDNYLCLIFLSLILFIIIMTDEIRISVIIMPLWIGILWGCFIFLKKIHIRNKK